MSDLLIGARAAHFASSLLIAGTAIFSTFVAAPILARHPLLLGRIERRLDRAMMSAIIVAILSGALWLIVVAADLGDSSLADAAMNGNVLTILTGMQFGIVFAFRFVLALCLVPLLVAQQLLPSSFARVAAWLIAVLAVAFAAGLAACGHAGSGIGLDGAIHLINDAVHLGAASCWAGGLLPFVIAIAPQEGLTPALRVGLMRRFSSLAFASVAALLASGIVNSWFMLPELAAMGETDYGRLLLVKIALFALMLGLGGANRYWLIPRLAREAAGRVGARAISQIVAMASIELGLAFAVICVVAVLGQLQPPGS